MVCVDRSVPGGCFAAILGLVSWAYSALAAYGVWKAFPVRAQYGNGIVLVHRELDKHPVLLRD